MGSIKSRFIAQTLEKEGERMLRNQGEAMESSLRFHTRQTFMSRKMAVAMAGEDLSGTLTFSHLASERFLDLRSLRHGSISVKRPQKRQIHNRFVYGLYGSVGRRLMYGFTEEVAATLRNQFEKDLEEH